MLYDPHALALYLDDSADPPQLRPLLRLPATCAVAGRYACFGNARIVMPARLQLLDLQALLSTSLGQREALLEMAESQWQRVPYYHARPLSPAGADDAAVRAVLRSAAALSGKAATLHWRWGEGLYMQGAEPPLGLLDDRRLARAFVAFYRTHRQLPQARGVRGIAGEAYTEDELHRWRASEMMARKGAPVLDGDSCALRMELQREVAALLEAGGVPLEHAPRVATAPTMRLVRCAVWLLDAPTWDAAAEEPLWQASQRQQLAPQSAWAAWGRERRAEELATLHFAKMRLPPSSVRYVGVADEDTWRAHWQALSAEDRAYYGYKRVQSSSLTELSYRGYHHLAYRLLQQGPSALVRAQLEAYVAAWERLPAPSPGIVRDARAIRASLAALPKNQARGTKGPGDE